MKSLLIALATLSLMAPPVFAQDTSETDEEDVVTATGTTTRNDAAMAAWAAGDYVTAEIEFDRNQTCALRGLREFRAGVEASGEGALRAEIDAGASASPQASAGGQSGGPTQVPQGISATSQVGSSNFRKKKDKMRASCDDRPFDLYMRGMSQIKLGKFDDAKDSLKRSVALRKTNCDAYFRLALLELQAGETKSARKRYKQLRNAAKKDTKRLERKGKRCDLAETQAQIAYLQSALQ